MNARELHDATLDLLEKGVDRLCYGTDERKIVLRALDLLARTEESTDELVRELHAFRESAKPFPSGAGGQQCGMESYRIVASGNQLEVIYTAAARIVALNENCAMLKRTVENQDAYIVALKAERDALKEELSENWKWETGGAFTLEGAGPDSLDAARYRYLRNVAGQIPDDKDGPMICSGLGDNFDYLRGAECDEAVDAAIVQFGSAHAKDAP